MGAQPETPWQGPNVERVGARHSGFNSADWGRGLPESLEILSQLELHLENQKVDKLEVNCASWVVVRQFMQRWGKSAARPDSHITLSDMESEILAPRVCLNCSKSPMWGLQLAPVR